MNATLTVLREELRPLAGVTLLLMAITAVLYPLAVTGIGQALFDSKANGSLRYVAGEPVGSALVGQAFDGETYFHGRPSAAGEGYDAASSSGSNLGPTSATLAELMAARIAAYREANGLDDHLTIPADAVTASASGLDPHISPANARLQAARVAAARGVPEEAVLSLIDDYTESPALGFIGEERVNVLAINIALDSQFPVPE